MEFTGIICRGKGKYPSSKYCIYFLYQDFREHFQKQGYIDYIIINLEQWRNRGYRTLQPPWLWSTSHLKNLTQKCTRLNVFWIWPVCKEEAK